MDRDFIKQWYGFIVAVSYGVISIAITFFNKAVFSTYNFDGSNTLTLAQGIFSLTFLVILKRYKFIEYKDYSTETAKKLYSLAGAFLGMVISGLAALKFVNVPMYGTLRRITTFIVIISEYYLLNKTVPKDEFLSVVLMVVGAMVAGWGDLSFDFYGYFLTILNCAITAVYLVLIAKKSRETELNTFGLMFYNNLLSIPALFILVLATEWDMLTNFPYWTNIGFHFVFWGSAIQAFLLNYFVFLCSTVNSPLTTSITGQLKGILQTIFGLFTFGGVLITMSLIVGLLMSTIGGIWYGYIKYITQINAIKKQVQDNSTDLEKSKDSPLNTK